MHISVLLTVACCLQWCDSQSEKHSCYKVIRHTVMVISGGHDFHVNRSSTMIINDHNTIVVV